MQDENPARNTVVTDDVKVLSERPYGGCLTGNPRRNFFRNWQALSIAALLGIAGGIAVYFFVPPKFQATLVARVGKAMINVEPDRLLQKEMVRAVAWLRSEEFVDALMASMANPVVPAGDNRPVDEKLFRESLQSRVIPGSQLLRIDFLGYSHAQLNNYANALQKEVPVLHEQYLTVQQMELELLRQENESELAAEEIEYQDLRRNYSLVLQQSQQKQLKFASDLVENIQKRGESIESLRKVQRDLDRRVFLAQLYPVVISQIEIYEKPVPPKIKNFLFGGIVVGFFCGFLYLIIFRKIRFSVAA